MKAGARLALDLLAPTVVDRQNRAFAADQCNLLHQAINDFLDFLEIDTLIRFVSGMGDGSVRSRNVHQGPPSHALKSVINMDLGDYKAGGEADDRMDKPILLDIVRCRSTSPEFHCRYKTVRLSHSVPE